jgi:hypothetical protein
MYSSGEKQQRSMFAKVRSTFATTRSLAEVVREAFARHRDDARAVVDCSEA